MKTKILSIMLVSLLLSSCSTLIGNNNSNRTISSSLMDFLYPGKQNRDEFKPEVPVLRLPVNVGLAFVPSTSRGRGGIESKNEIELLEKVRKSFIKNDFIGRIEVIPSIYLKGGDGFATLEQVSRLHDVEVMALVSYDQVTQSHENFAGLLYWTIVGLYVIPANENSIQTFVDTAVFDVASRKLLFRAPGISKLEKKSTAIGVTKAIEAKSLEGFELAVVDMIDNLDGELSRFKVRVKEEKIAKVEHRAGYSGGGSMGEFILIFRAAVLIVRYSRRRSTGLMQLKYIL